MNVFAALEGSRLALALGVMTYAAYSDWKTREVEPKLWLITSIIGGILTITELYLLSTVAKNLFLWGLIDFLFSFLIFPFLYVMYKGGVLGGADMLAYLFLTFTLPWYPLILGIRAISPIPFLTLLYASISAIIFSLIRMVSNLLSKDFKDFMDKHEIRGLARLHYAMSGKVFRAEDYLKTKFWYLLSRFEEGEKGIEVEFRRRIDLEEEPADHRKEIKELIESGKISKDEKVLASYGMPFLVFMLFGLIMSLIIGDFWLRALFGA